MYIRKRSEIDKINLKSDTLKNAEKQVLIGSEEGWDSHVMRMFTLGKDGYSPKHSHPWKHIVYIVKGEGVILIDNIEYPVSADSVAVVPGDTVHQFSQKGEGEFVFMCIVPTEGDI
ncbi:MAG: cupin domain-containing protein [Spirochaetes bacterium]|nr:MAG: cupin domain-containing protein [Spirochaetota bacterium]